MERSGLDSQAVNALRGAIYAGARARETTARIWSRIRGALDLPDEGPTGIRRGLVNSIWNEAVQVRNSQEAIDRALTRMERTGLDSTITANMVAVPTWARAQAERNAVPRFQVNYKVAYTDAEGNRQERWNTSVFGPEMAQSVAGLKDQVTFDAEMQAMTPGDTGLYGATDISVSAIQILAI